MTVFPTLIFFLFWIQGHQVAKKKEIAKMKAKDIRPCLKNKSCTKGQDMSN